VFRGFDWMAFLIGGRVFDWHRFFDWTMVLIGQTDGFFMGECVFYLST
jgi:hypothetical protein